MKSKYDIAEKIKELPEDKAYFTISEAVALSGMCEKTIRKRIQDGTIKAKKIGGKWKIYADSLKKNNA